MKDFNDHILPRSLRADANVRAAHVPASGPIEFVKYEAGALGANSLLKSGMPVVAGVDRKEESESRDHFTALVLDRNNNLWAVDPWDKSTYESAVMLPGDWDLTKPIKVSMNAGNTTIPCPRPWFGLYGEKLTHRSLPVAVSL